MSEIRHALEENFDHSSKCLFCHDLVVFGAAWHGTGSLYVCADCISDGRLGALVGDALETKTRIERALVATEREAWRARVLALERRQRNQAS